MVKTQHMKRLEISTFYFLIKVKLKFYTFRNGYILNILMYFISISLLDSFNLSFKKNI